MTIIDEQLVHAPADLCFQIAADVERWPEILPHYRWVRFRERQQFGHGIVDIVRLAACHRQAGAGAAEGLGDTEIDAAGSAEHHDMRAAEIERCLQDRSFALRR